MYLYVFLFHPIYLHSDNFRYMTHEITQDISCCYFTLYSTSTLPL